MINLHARKIGSLVNLDAPGYHLRGIFNRGSLAVSTAGAIIYLSSEDIKGPYNLFTPGLAEIIARLTDGQPLRNENGCLVIEDADVHIHTQTAAAWPRLQLPDTIVLSQQHAQIFTSIIERTVKNRLTDSQPFLSLADLWGYPGKPEANDLFSKPLWLLTRELNAALQSGDPCQAVLVSRRCLGLGEGLTPAGDDLVAGICAIFSFLRGKSVRQTDMRQKYCTQMVLDARKLTNTVSAAFIDAACKGEMNDPLNQIVSSLVKGVGVDNILLGQLSHTGHTSGYDGLAGIMLAMNLDGNLFI